MELKIKISTPEGFASVHDPKLKIIKSMFIKKARIIKETISKKKDSIIYTVDCDYKSFVRINKVIGMWGIITKSLFNNKLFSKAIKKMADSPQDYETVKDLITGGTTMEILKF